MSLLDNDSLAQLAGVKLRAQAVMEGALSGLHKNSHPGQSVEFSEHKDYSPGDEIRHLDWKAFGKFDKYYVKQFEHESNLRALMAIDASASMAYQSGPLSKWDVACTLAGALSYLLIRQQDAVGLAMVQKGGQHEVAIRSSANHLQVLFEAFETVTPRGQTDLSALAQTASERLPRRSLLFVFSDFFDEREEGLRRLIQLKKQKHDITFFHVLDSAELDFPFKDTTLFESMEDERRVEVQPAELKDSYLAELQAFIKTVRLECSKADIYYQQVRTDQRLDASLRQFLSRRRERRK